MRRTNLRSSLGIGLTLAAAALLLTPHPSAAQYFGRNKVQYESFDFKVLETEHFDIYYYPSERDAALLAARMAERWYSRYARLLGHELGSRQAVIMYADHPAFEQTNALSGELGEATGGVTEVFKRRIVLPFAAGLKDTDHVLGHELVHAFQYDITGEGRSVQTGGIPGALRMPLWFIEGMAEYLSIGPVDPNTAMWMRDATREHLPTITQLGDSYRWFPYRWGQALWAYLAGRYGDEVVTRLLKNAGRSTDFEQAMAHLLGSSLEGLTDNWHQELKEAYDPLVALTQPAADYGKTLFDEKRVMNVAPVLSPDGTQLAFISTRDLFSIDVFIGDVETGRVVRKLTHTAVDPHLESLEFINSAGVWSPDGKTFALAGVSRGRPLLTLIDVASGKHTRDIPFPQLGEIYSPSWSPDGRYLAFSALQGGLSDLFVYDLEREQLRRLTNDPYGDLQPAWSPDGTTLAFASDRFTTQLDSLAYGDYQIVTYDLASGAMRAVPGFAHGKHINPQWSRDGKSIFFLSDQNGITNLYRVALADGAIAQVTNLYTGIAGITPTSPALSVAQDADRVVISVYGAEGYHLHLLEDATQLAGTPVVPAFASVQPARLPPPDPLGTELVTMLADARTGLPDTAEFVSKEYSPRLGLDYLAQPSLVLGSDRYGTYIGAGAALYWSDMLGNRNLTTALQVNGSVKDISAVLGYTNLKHRLNWGVVGQQLVYLSGYYAAGLSNNVFVEQQIKYRQTDRDLAGLVSYALSRAQRIEGSAGLRNIGFEQEVKTFFTDFSGNSLGDTTATISYPGLTVGTASAALVYDQSVFGATSPVLGQRYRLEFSPVVGSVDYLGVLADYRRYVVPVRPFTIAARLMHYGRYGSGGEDYRLQPLFLGYQSVMRGYSYGSFQASDCQATADDPCPLFSRLIGSHILVGNLEFRFPLLGALGVGSGYYGFLPIELAFFADAGIAWSSDNAYTLTGAPTAADERAFFLGGDRKPVYSAGIALRANLLGFAVVELDLSRAFQRIASDGSTGRWVWQFGFVPGF
jgi:Tol biopolymer transport system component